MQNLTFCIPVRIDSEYRLRNLLTILKFYSHHLSSNYIVLEADNQQHVKELPHIPGLVYEFIYDENPVFIEHTISTTCYPKFLQKRPEYGIRMLWRLSHNYCRLIRGYQMNKRLWLILTMDAFGTSTISSLLSSVKIGHKAPYRL